MLIALLLAAAAPAPASPEDKALEASPTFQAYREWRLCLDGRLGRPPYLLPPGQAALEATFSECRPKEEALASAAKAEWGPAAGPAMFDSFSKEIRAEYGGDALRQ
jgi:hypothetical protein